MTPAPFADRLDAAVAAVGNPCLLGLDPHPGLLPEPYSVAARTDAPRAERADAIARFCNELVELAAGKVAAVKPQSAFFELFGADGARAWEDVVARAHEHGLLVIGDVKRSDIQSTAAAYADAFLGGIDDERAHLCDAVTLNPYLGTDSIAPFLKVCDERGAGIFVLVRTSNPSGAELQRHGAPPLAEVVARRVDGWGEALVGSSGLSSVGAVVGATHADELARFRELMPRAPLLLPGYGAQGAGAGDVVAAFADRAHPYRGALVNSSRAIAFASRRPEHAHQHWKDAARAALDGMIEDLRRALAARAS